jgi:hypothetical protein
VRLLLFSFSLCFSSAIRSRFPPSPLPSDSTLTIRSFFDLHLYLPIQSIICALSLTIVLTYTHSYLGRSSLPKTSQRHGRCR